MSVSLNFPQVGLYLNGYIIFLLVSLKNQSYFILSISRITEQTILFRSWYVLVPLYKLKIFSKYSYHLLIQPKTFFICCCSQVSLCKNYSFLNFESEGLYLQALYKGMNIHFGSFYPDDTITWKNVIQMRGDSSFNKANDLGCAKDTTYPGRDNFYM